MKFQVYDMKNTCIVHLHNRLFNFGVPNIIINKTLEIVALTTPTKHY
jgi:hypothetical protein